MAPVLELSESTAYEYLSLTVSIKTLSEECQILYTERLYLSSFIALNLKQIW
jgi:hypothetical protein